MFNSISNTCSILLLLAGISFLENVPVNEAISNEEFLTLTLPQKEKLDEFAGRVRPLVTQNYMLREVYLIRWLREVDFNVDKAERLLGNNLKWRKDNDIDHVLDGDYAELDSYFTTDVVGCDKEGLPVLVLMVQDWDLRSIIITYGTEKLAKYADKLVEEMTTMERRMEEDGQNVTQFSIIIDMEGFNLIQHGCPNCIAFLLRLLARLQYNYPGYVHKVLFINTPQIALPLWNTYKGLLMRSLREAVEIYGANRKHWQRPLLEWVDPSQLTTHFGGLRDRGLDLQEYRLSGDTFSCNSSMWDEIDDLRL